MVWTQNQTQETLEAYKEIECPALYFKIFNCFSGLPLEIRRKIWLYALPEPRLVNLELDPNPKLTLENDRHPESISIAIRDYILTADDTKDRYMSIDIRPFFLTCHEFKDVFLEHYKSFDIPTQITVRCIENPPSQCYIDPKADCLKFNNLKESIEILSSIGITLNFSALRHIAIAKYSKSGTGSLIFESTWKAIEDNFPQLKSVTLSGNNGGTHVEKLPMGIRTFTRFHRLIEDTIGEFCRQTVCQYYNGLAPLNSCIVDTHYMDIIWKAAYRHNESFLERTNINGDYWKGVNLTTSLWMEHTLHRAKEYIQLKPRIPFEGDQITIFYTQAVGKFYVSSAYVKLIGGLTVIDCYADSTLFNSEEAREKGNEFHETHSGDGSKYLTWPWNRPSLGENDAYDNSRFRNRVYRTRVNRIA
ncbi:hypothetical protein BOTNAR_0337g00070 [Botryotinia narcissicola]|uniref:2EXR domain-containing protein n=1 Tax=Botryotinia narcissicola TaxID=278944 RepID=A0A4Z1HT20_9HELO|nr:hypothetical protein BOTNAR_0337g00070 [Botryotinia narcissicola]